MARPRTRPRYRAKAIQERSRRTKPKHGVKGAVKSVTPKRPKGGK